MTDPTPTVRICVAIDVPTLSGNTFEAYQRLISELQGFRFGWQTTNEWYDAAGEPIPEHEVERITAGPRGETP